MPLTDNACRNAKPDSKPRKLADGGGLYLLVQPNGSKLWRMNYRFEGKHKTLAFGVYPTVSLAAAREARQNAKAGLATGRDPSKPLELQPGTATFEAVGREWWESRRAAWTEKYGNVLIARLEADVFPEIGHLPIAEIEAPTVLAALRKTEARGVQETSRRLLQMIGNIFRYAIATGRAKRDPAADLKGALKARPRVKHMAALKASELPDFYVRLDRYDGEVLTRLAVELTIHTMTRTGEIRFATWKEFEDDLWRVPPERMKMGREHLVPLTPQSKAILARLRRLTGDGEFVFPGRRRGAMSENTMLYALYRMGYHGRSTIHGFRSTASTVLNESGLWSPDAIERQLAHVPADRVRSAYNAAQYWEERVRMMRWWGTFLKDQARLGQMIGEPEKGDPVNPSSYESSGPDRPCGSGETRRNGRISKQGNLLT